MTINYPPGFVPAAKRSDEEIMQELNRRTGYVQGECRTLDPALASPAPEETYHHPTKFIQHLTGRRNKPVAGLASACGLNSVGKKRKGVGQVPATKGEIQ